MIKEHIKLYQQIKWEGLKTIKTYTIYIHSLSIGNPIPEVKINGSDRFAVRFMFKDITETEDYTVNPIIDKETLEHIFGMETSSICHSIRFYCFRQGKYISSEGDSNSRDWSDEFSLGSPKEMVKLCENCDAVVKSRLGDDIGEEDAKNLLVWITKRLEMVNIDRTANKTKFINLWLQLVKDPNLRIGCTEGWKNGHSISLPM